MGIIMAILGVAVSLGIMLFVNKNKKINKDFTTLFIVAALIAVVLEFTTFNYTSYENFGKSLKKSESVVTVKDGNFVCDDNNIKVTNIPADGVTKYSVEITNIDSKVTNVSLAPSEDMGKIKVFVEYKDDVFTDYEPIYNTESYVVPNVTNTEYIRLHLAGKTQAVKLIMEMEGTYINNASFKVGVNNNIPFNISAYRVVLIVIILFALAIIYKKRNLNYSGKKSKKVRRAAILSLLILQTLFMFFLAKSQQDSKKAFLLEDENTFTYEAADQYQQLAISLANGQTHLDGLDDFSSNTEKKELDALSKMKDPYKPNLREKAVKDNGVAYRWDEAFYNGHYYTYYGPVPVIVSFLPVYLLTGKMLATRIVTLLFAIIISMLMCLLVHNIAKRRKINLWIVIGTMAASLSTMFLTSVFQGAKIYELSPLGGLMFVLAGINLIYEGIHKEEKNLKFFALGALAFALAVGCKASFLLASLVVLPMVLNYFASRGKSTKENKFVRYISNIFCKDNIKLIAGFAAPYVVVGILLMIYNMVRFGSPFDFGVTHQLTVFDTSYFKIYDISKLGAVIENGLLKLPESSMVFPFLKLPDPAVRYFGYMFYMAGIGVFAYPFIWAFVGTPVIARNSLKKSKDKAFVIASFVMALVMCYVTIVMGGPSFRYSLDFGWAFVIPSIFVIFAIEKWARDKRILRKAWLAIIVVITATILINTLVSMSTGFNAGEDTRPDLYYYVFHTVMFWR